MRFITVLLLVLTAVALGFTQGYKPKSGETVLKMEVEGRGDVYILLYAAQAPKTVGHISQLAKSGFYNGQRFHRVERSPRPYLVQVGDPASKSGDLAAAGSGGSGAKIPFENSGFAHGEGAVGLARGVQDADSGDSQFYITLAPQKFLDGKYTVFGKVVAGMDVVRKIERGDRVISLSVLP